MKYAMSIAVVGLMLAFNSQPPAPEVVDSSAAGSALSGDWPQWRGPNRDGIAAGSPPLSWPATGPKVLWKSEQIPANLEGGFGSVSVADGRVYVFVSWRSGFKGNTGPQDVIVCLDEANGKTLWMTGFPSVKTDHPSGGTPCVAGDKVFAFGSRRLYCVDAKTGRALWQSGVTGGQISSSPLFADHLVFALSDSLRAYNPNGGDPVDSDNPNGLRQPKLLWEQPKAAGGPSFEGVEHTSYNCSPALWRKDGVTYIITCGDKLTCVEAKTGAVKWQAPGPGGASATPAIWGDYVVINYGLGRGTYAYRMTPEKAEQLWRISKSDRGTTPVILDGYVYAYGGGSYACYELTTGEEKWKQRFGGEISSPIAADGKIFGLYSGSSAIMVFKATPERFVQIDNLQTSAVVASSPTVANGNLYLRKGNCVACYGLTSDPDEQTVLPPLAVAAGKPLRILIGSTRDWTDAEGNLWSADAFANSGESFAVGEGTGEFVDLPAIYRSGRKGLTGLNLHLVDGVYTVRTHFCETDEGIAEPGLRVMTLYVNGREVEDIDPFGDTGGRGFPLVKQVTTTVKDGWLKIALVSLNGETHINALEILPGDLPEPPAAERKPIPLPVAPVSAPSKSGVAMRVGVIDMPIVRHQTTRIPSTEWVTALESSSWVGDRLTVRRITSLEELMGALAHPEKWLAIINPYGEAFPVAGPTRWKEILAGIRQYVRHGGNWFETGGYPFFEGFFQEDGGVASARIMGEGMDFLGLGVSGGPQKAPLEQLVVTATGKQVLGEEVTAVVLKTPCEINRPLPADDAHLTLIAAEGRDYMGGYSLGGWGRLWRFGGSRASAEMAIPVTAAIVHYTYTHPPQLSNQSPAPETTGPSASGPDMSRDWPQWRGPNRDGIAPNSPPLSWSGVLWKVPVPAPGNSSPIVWGDRVFLSGGDANNRTVFCFHAINGDLLWERILDLPMPPGGQDWDLSEPAGMASPTMATDGHRAYAIFANGDLAAFDFEGNRVWARNLGLPENDYGHTASLALWRNRLIVQMDQGAEDDNLSRLIAIDSATGQSIWEKNRPVDASWTSPIVVRAAGRNQILALSAPWAISYDAMDGSELWRLGGISGEVTPSPIFAAGLFFVISPFETLYAIKPDGRGDITNTHVVWTSDEWVPDICSPVSNGDLLFTLMTSGLLTCFDVKDGKKQWEHDFDMEIHASPAIVDKRLYLFGHTGKALVLEVSRQFKELARSDLAETIYTSPAFAQNRIYIRSTKSLFCLGDKSAGGPVRSPLK